MQKRLVYADILKGGLILTVVLGHAVQSVYMAKGEDFLSSYLWRLIYSFHMPAFMAVSGYLTYNASKIKKINLLDSSIRRFRQLIVPFMIWSVMMYLVNHNVDNIFDYILYPNRSFWFLWALFFISTIFNSLLWLTQRISMKFEPLIVIVALLLIGLQVVLPNAKFLGFEYIAYYFMYFSLGYILHKYDKLVPKSTIVLVLLVAVWCLLGSFWQPKAIPVLVPQFMRALPMINVLYRILTAFIFIIAMFGLAVKIEMKDSFIFNTILQCGQISLGIYTVHMVIRKRLVEWMIVLFPSMNDTFYILLTFVILMALSVLIVKLINRWRFSSIWLLGKV